MAPSMDWSLRPVTCPDWESLRLPGEIEWRRSISLPSVPTLPRTRALRVRETLSPTLISLVDRWRRALRLREPALFLNCRESAPARIEGSDANEIAIHLSPSAVERFTPREWTFVLGSALAPVILKHVCHEARNDPRWTILSRFERLSADRMGLLSCQDLRTAIRAMMKETTGLPEDWLATNVTALVTHRRPEEIVLLEGDEAEFLSLRMASLIRFAAGPAFRSFFESPSNQAPTARESADPRQHEPREISIVEREPVTAGTAEIDDREPPPMLPTDPLSQWRSRVVTLLFEPAHQQSLPRQLALADYREQFQLPLDVDQSSIPMDEVERAVRDLDWETKLGLIRELLPVVTAEGTLSRADRAALDRLVEGIELDRESVDILAAEFVDPEFASYPFQVGERVEVQLDGAWVKGIVAKREPPGTLGIRLDGDEEPLVFSPTADLVRPIGAGRQAA